MSRLNIEKVEHEGSSKYLPAYKLNEIVDAYISRKKIEEAECVEKLGGNPLLCLNADSNLSSRRGLSNLRSTDKF